jgi:hypothetical protein
LPSSLNSELARPQQFADATRAVTEESVASSVVCGPDPDLHLQEIARFVGAGFNEIYIHQIGPDQRGFLDFYRDRILPEFG